MYKGSKKYFYQEMGIFNSSMEFFLSILSVAVVTVGGTLIMQGRMDVVDLLTFTLYITTFVNPIRKLANFAEMFANGTAGLERFVEIMRTEPALRRCTGRSGTARKSTARSTSTMSAFAYEGELDVLHDVSLHVDPGETIAVVGPSGGGKSTLCQLIPRFYDVTDGAICVDGQDVRAVTQQSLRRAIGVVQQDVFLFADSILREHPLRPPGRDDGRDRGGGEAGGNLRRHHGDARRLQHLRRRARHAPVRRAEAAHLHCPRLPEGSVHSDPRRGDLRARLHDRGKNSARL